MTKSCCVLRIISVYNFGRAFVQHAYLLVPLGQQFVVSFTNVIFITASNRFYAFQTTFGPSIQLPLFMPLSLQARERVDIALNWFLTDITKLLGVFCGSFQYLAICSSN